VHSQSPGIEYSNSFKVLTFAKQERLILQQRVDYFVSALSAPRIQDYRSQRSTGSLIGPGFESQSLQAVIVFMTVNVIQP